LTEDDVAAAEDDDEKEENNDRQNQNILGRHIPKQLLNVHLHTRCTGEDTFELILFPVVSVPRVWSIFSDMDLVHDVPVVVVMYYSLEKDEDCAEGQQH
jgi:hypothetical protein